MEIELSTEEKIRKAALSVFVAKGFTGCTSREIAKEAGMNVALVNYYFCSKKQLFKLVFETVMHDFLIQTMEIFKSDLDLESKVRIFIEKEYEFQTIHPDIPQFIISELSRKDNKFEFDTKPIIKKITETGVFDELKKAQDVGIMRKMDIVNILILIISNCQYPFIGKTLIKNINELSDEQYSNVLMLHKQYVIEMLVNYLFINKSK